MRVLIRCDGGGARGAGHVMRALAVAGEARDRGHDVDLLAALAGSWLVDAVEELGLGLIECEPGQYLGDDLVRRAQSYDLVHIDHYDAEPEVLARLVAHADATSTTSRRVLLSNVSDGLYGARPSDCALDAAPGAETAAPSTVASVQLLGLRYALVRKQVRAMRRAAKSCADTCGDPSPLIATVVMGGTDPTGLAGKVTDTLAADLRSLDMTATVHVVATARTEEALQARVESFPGELKVRPAGGDLLTHFAGSDLVITAGGTTMWELCVLRTPMVVVAAVENQRAGSDYLIEAGAAATLDGLPSVLTDPARRRQLAETAGALVDGLGAWRLVSTWELIASQAATDSSNSAVRERHTKIAMRPAQRDDAETLLRWRNDPQTRAVSRSTEKIDLTDHIRWLESALARADRVLLIAQADIDGEAAKIGTVRWDRLQEPGSARWEVSITLAPEARGRKLASQVLRAAEIALLERVSGDCTAWVASVHIDNQASMRLFRHGGYLPDAPADDQGFAQFSKPVLHSA